MEPNITTTLYKINTLKDLTDIIEFMEHLHNTHKIPKTMCLVPIFYQPTHVVKSKQKRQYDIHHLAYTITNINHFIQHVHSLGFDGINLDKPILSSNESRMYAYIQMLEMFKDESASNANYDIYLIGMLKSDRTLLSRAGWSPESITHFMTSSDTYKLNYDINNLNLFKKKRDPVEETGEDEEEEEEEEEEPEEYDYFSPENFDIYIQVLNECISIFYIPHFTISESNVELIKNTISELYNKKNNTDAVEIVGGAVMLLIIDTFEISDYDKDMAKKYVLKRMHETYLSSNNPIPYRQMLTVRSSFWLGPEWDKFTDLIKEIIPPPTTTPRPPTIGLAPDEIYPERIDNIIFKISTQADIDKVIKHLKSNEIFKTLSINVIIYNPTEDLQPSLREIPYSRLDNAYKIQNINRFVYTVKTVFQTNTPINLQTLKPGSLQHRELYGNLTSVINNPDSPDIYYIMGIHVSDYAYMYSRHFSPNSWIWFFQASHTHYMGDGTPPRYHITADEIDTENPAFHPQITSISNTLIPLTTKQFNKTHTTRLRTKPIAYPTHRVAESETKNRHLIDKASVIIYTYVHGAITPNQTLMDGIIGHLYRLETTRFDPLDELLFSNLQELITTTTRTIPEIANDIHSNFMYWAWQLCNVYFGYSMLPEFIDEFKPSILENPNTFIDQPISHFIDTKLDKLRNHQQTHTILTKEYDNKFKYSDTTTQIGFTSTMNNTFNAHSRIPYYDVRFALNETNEPGNLISLVGVIPSLGENNNNTTKITEFTNIVTQSLMDRLNNQTLTSSERITDTGYLVTLSYILVSLYLIFKGNVVSYIIDPSCKSDSYYKETVMKYIPTTSEYHSTKHRLIPPVLTHKGEHLLDESIDKTNINYSEEYALWLRRQQHEGKGKKRIKTKKIKIHKKFTRKLSHNNKKHSKYNKKSKKRYQHKK
jgi:hypothetical protein